MSADRKKNRLFIVLSGLFVANALLAELIGVKIFSLEKSLGLPGAALTLPGANTPLSFNLTTGVFIWPVVFLTTDLINEYFGKQGVRFISFLTAALITYAFVVIYAAIALAPAEFWLNTHATDPQGRSFDINFAFRRIFGQGLGIIAGSLVAFLIGQLLDVFVFQRLRRWTGSAHLWLRATGSTLFSQLIDSFVVLFLAFYLLADPALRWSPGQVFSVATLNYLYKFSAALLLTPLVYVAHWWIDRYLGASLSKEMQTKAAQKSTGFF